MTNPPAMCISVDNLFCPIREGMNSDSRELGFGLVSIDLLYDSGELQKEPTLQS
jgi:hypothetical protein